MLTFSVRRLRERVWAQHVFALLGYLCASLIITWPLITVFGRAVTTGQGIGFAFQDASQNIWNMWWVRYAFDHSQNPFWTTHLYYPDGVQMYIQTLNVSNALLTLPVNYLAGPLAAYHAAVLLGFTLTGYGGFLLARAFVPHYGIAFVCGVLLTACPFHIMTLQDNQLQLISMQWVPLYVLALVQLERQRGWRSILFAIVVAVLLVLTDWYWVLICGAFTAAWLLGLVFVKPRWALLQRYGLFVAGTALVLAPLFVGIARARASLPKIDLAHDATWNNYNKGFSADALGLLLPSLFRPELRELMPFDRPGFGAEGWYVAAGWTLAICAIIGVWVAWRTQWRMLCAAAMVWVLSLGPTLWLAGRDTGLPAPYALLQRLPFLSIARRPALFAVMCIVLATIFAALGLYALLQRWRRWPSALLLAVIALAALAEAGPPPRDVVAFAQPGVYTQLRARPGTVADLPVYLRYEDSHVLRDQIAHEQPTLAGYVARWPDYSALKYSPLLDQLVNITLPRANDIVARSQDELRAMQCAYPIRNVVLRKAELSARQQQIITQTLATLVGQPLTPWYNDADYAAYELPTLSSACKPYLALGAGWSALQTHKERRWRLSKAESQVWIVNPFNAPTDIDLQFVAQAGDAAHTLELWQNDTCIRTWTIRQRASRHTLRLQIPPGHHDFLFRTAALNEGQSQEPPSIQFSSLALADASATITPR